jgi:hypothetical protein
VQGTGSVRIDAGGSGYGSFVADEDYVNPPAPASPSITTETTGIIDTSGVTDPAPQSVYQTYRYGTSFTYSIPNLTPGTSYTVRLHFAETYWSEPGKRIFNVILNGQVVLSNFDIFAAAGGSNKAIVEQFVTQPNSDGTITIQFETVDDFAEVNGIEVLAN